MRVEQLASAQEIPPKYLVQILLDLKADGIVRSQRGKEGGYLLARPPGEITLADVIRAVDGRLFETPALEDPSCPIELKRAWATLRHAIEDGAGAINFQQLLEEDQASEKMYYI